MTTETLKAARRAKLYEVALALQEKGVFAKVVKAENPKRLGIKQGGEKI